MGIRKGSPTVTLYAWALMLISVIDGVFTVDFYRCTACSHTLPQQAVIAYIGFSCLSALCGVAAGSGILGLRERARLLGVILCAANLASAAFFACVSGKDMRSYVYAAVDSVISGSGSVADPVAVYRATLGALIVLFVLAAVFRAGFIVYFTRPRVRKLFS